VVDKKSTSKEDRRRAFKILVGKLLKKKIHAGVNHVWECNVVTSQTDLREEVSGWI
jgi:hypothetical protein